MGARVITFYTKKCNTYVSGRAKALEDHAREAGRKGFASDFNEYNQRAKFIRKKYKAIKDYQFLLGTMALVLHYRERMN
jgi:hypothetical protein